LLEKLIVFSFFGYWHNLFCCTSAIIPIENQQQTSFKEAIFDGKEAIFDGEGSSPYGSGLTASDSPFALALLHNYGHVFDWHSMRFFTEFTLRFFAALRMTDEGFRVTSAVILLYFL